MPNENKTKTGKCCENSHPYLIGDGTQARCASCGAETENGHNCNDYAEYVTWDGPLGHGWVCGRCGLLIQVG